MAVAVKSARAATASVLAQEATDHRAAARFAVGTNRANGHLHRTKAILAILCLFSEKSQGGREIAHPPRSSATHYSQD
eukprot:6200408-Pleurochrysis_carterae.AAC.2